MSESPKPKRPRSLSELCDEVSQKSTGSSMSSSAGTRRERMLQARKANKPCFERHKEIGSLFIRNNNDDSGRLTEGMNVLSWDCGITNLCYCLIELVGSDTGNEMDFRVIMWENFSLNSQTMMQAVSALVKELDSRPWMMDVDSVCIENQVLKNVQMKIMSHCIQGYFETRGAARARANSHASTLPNGMRIIRKGKGGPKVHFIKADSKFKAAPHIEIPAKIEKLSRRLRNKRAAVYLASELLKRKGYTTSLNFLQSFDKQDDLSDAFLQGLYFLKQQKHTKENTDKLKRFMGMSEMKTIEIPNPNEKGKSKNKKKTTKKLKVDKNTGTQKEEYDHTHDGMNEGCEYDKEVPLPQMYVNKHFVVPRYDTNKADISMITRYMRNSKTIDHDDEDDDDDDEEILNFTLKKKDNKVK